jgi:DNA-binding NarL/FixJ family response regulator
VSARVFAHALRNIVGVFGIAIPSSDDLPRPSATEELSPRQLDVLRLLVQGKSTNQIAADLHLAPETVRNYVGSLLKTLGARSRLEATLVALRDGVVSLDLD